MCFNFFLFFSEALLGWLHLSGRHDRVEQLFAVMMEEE